MGYSKRLLCEGNGMEVRLVQINRSRREGFDGRDGMEV